MADDPRGQAVQASATEGNAGRRLTHGDHFTRDEVRLALRNHGTPLEALRYDLTPIGLHYLLTHFDIPFVEPDGWSLTLDGLVERPQSMGLSQLRDLPAETRIVTMECAGNGRSLMEPHAVSQPWLEEAFGTAEWTGVPLRTLLERAGAKASAVEAVFSGIDAGTQGGERQQFQRSLSRDEALRDEPILAYAMNGQPLPPQHGGPLRLVVPGWYGVASVKWLKRIELVDRPFDGYQMTKSYRYTQSADDPGEPVTLMRPRALMVPPGEPDFLTRARLVAAGAQRIVGRAWSGRAAVVRVDFSADGGSSWQAAELAAPVSAYAWRAWSVEWQATPGEHTLVVRATDENGETQPLEPVWNLHGMGNNVAQRVPVRVE